MAVSFTQDDDYIIPSHDGQAYLGLGGDDTYIISSATISPDTTIVILDTQGSNNLIQLVGGLGIASSRVIGDAIELTLTSNAKVQILGASDFLYDVGGNATIGVSGTLEDFNTFVTNTLGQTDSGSGGNTNNDDTELLSSAQSKSAVISGIDHDTLVPFDNYIVAALYEGDSWLNFQDASASVTYSFNETLPSEYTWPDTRNWEPLASHVQDVVNEVISITDGIILPDIEEISSNGQIRFNMVETDSGTAAYAYFPGSGVGGDVFLGLDVGTGMDSGNVEIYGAGRSTIVHELGHALGLTHPFEGASILSASEDHSANTVMSYTDFRIYVPQFSGTQTGSGSEVNVAYDMVTPDQFMLHDIAALQAAYGPDTNYRVSDTTYTFADTPFYTTIWDAGGDDALDFSDTGYYNVIDLTPGTHSDINFRDIDTQIAEQQAVYQSQLGTSYYDDWVADKFTDQSSTIYTGENVLGIAWGTIIEKVTGGPAGNRITDNAVDNYLTGGTADDRFCLGAGGFDTVVGGGGYDLVILEQYTMDQVELGSHEDSVLLAGNDFAVQMQGIAGVQFADQLYTVV